MGVKVVTGKARMSYANVFEPKSINGSDPKYSVSVLIPKSDKATLKKIQDGIEAAIEDGKTKLADKNGKINKAVLKLPLRDGDTERPDDPVYAGHYFVNANASESYPPKVFDAALNPIMDRNEFYSGCYARASLTFYAFSASGNRGIAAGLNGLQKVADGEPLGGGGNVEADFDDDFEIEDDILG